MNEYPEHQDQKRSRGATAVEYALIVALIAGIIFVALSALGTKTGSLFEKTTTEMDNAGI